MLNPKSVVGIIILVLMISFGVYWRSHHVVLPPETELPHILKEAAGTAPIPANDTSGRKALRDSFKYLVDENKAYQIATNRLFTYGHLNGLLFPSTFTRPDGPQQIVKELQELKVVDEKHLKAIQRFPDVCREKLEDAGASKTEVEAFEQAMRKEMAGGLDQVTQAMELEMKWIDATVELYQYAADNSSHLSLRGATQLEFDNDDVRSQFMYLSQKVDELGEQRDTATANYQDLQRRNRQRLGVTEQDASAAGAN